MLQGPADHRGRRVVDDQRHAQLLADLRDLADGEDVQLRIGQGLGVVGTCLRVRCAPERLRVRRIDETHLDTHGPEGVREQVPGAAVEIGRADDVVAGLGNVLDRDRGRSLARAHEKGRGATLDRRHAFLERAAGRIHDPGIDVAHLLQTEQPLGVGRVRELVRRRLIDRDRDRTGRRVRAVSGVQRQGLRVLGLGHRLCSLLTRVECRIGV